MRGADGEVPDSPLSVAHRAAAPSPGSGLTRSGRCARCDTNDAATTPTSAAVSARFTDVDDWTDPGGAVLCRACTWAYRTPELRRVAHVITRDPPSVHPPGPHELHRLLSAPLPQTVALTVPTDGRKHLLPHARWGRIRTPDLTLAWTDGDAHRLTVMARLRGYGFTETALVAPAPDYATLSRLPSEVWEDVMDDWAALSPWRSAPPWWQVGVRATRGSAPRRPRSRHIGRNR